jgi:hypothetical protein
MIRAANTGGYAEWKVALSAIALTEKGNAVISATEKNDLGRQNGANNAVRNSIYSKMNLMIQGEKVGCIARMIACTRREKGGRCRAKITLNRS